MCTHNHTVMALHILHTSLHILTYSVLVGFCQLNANLDINWEKRNLNGGAVSASLDCGHICEAFSYCQGRRSQPSVHGAVLSTWAWSLSYMGLVHVIKVAEHTRKSEPEEASQWSPLLHGFCFQVLLCVPPMASLTGGLTCELKQAFPSQVALVMMSITATKYKLVMMLLICSLQNTHSIYILLLTLMWTQPHMRTLLSSTVTHSFFILGS